MVDCATLHAFAVAVTPATGSLGVAACGDDEEPTPAAAADCDRGQALHGHAGRLSSTPEGLQ
jgi:hypothetical protein